MPECQGSAFSDRRFQRPAPRLAGQAKRTRQREGARIGARGHRHLAGQNRGVSLSRFDGEAGISTDPHRWASKITASIASPIASQTACSVRSTARTPCSTGLARVAAGTIDVRSGQRHRQGPGPLARRSLQRHKATHDAGRVRREAFGELATPRLTASVSVILQGCLSRTVAPKCW